MLDLTAHHKWFDGVIDAVLEKIDIGDISDGYHTYNELYEHRAVLFANVCNAYPHLAWKSHNHDDPNFPMFDGMFIVGIETPDGQATYHYDLKWWDLFHVKVLDRAPVFDGHTPNDVIERLKSLIESDGWVPDDNDHPVEIDTWVQLMIERDGREVFDIGRKTAQGIWFCCYGHSSHHCTKVLKWKPLSNTYDFHY